MCRLFEPYVVQLIGKLLERFGDASAEVRAANDDAARSIMAHLSSYGMPDRLQMRLGSEDGGTMQIKLGKRRSAQRI